MMASHPNVGRQVSARPHNRLGPNQARRQTCRYLVGGLLAGPLTWRGPFMVESGAMLPMLILCALLPDRLSSAPKPGRAARDRQLTLFNSQPQTGNGPSALDGSEGHEWGLPNP